MAIAPSVVTFDIRNRKGGHYEVGMNLGGEDIYVPVHHHTDPLDEDDKVELVKLLYRHALSMKTAARKGDDEPSKVEADTTLGPLAL